MTLLGLLLLPGCSSWIDQESGCGFAVYSWSDDLLAHILTGDGSGAFDYDPDDTPRNDIKGMYDPANGDYDWSESYANSYYIKHTDVSGFGTVYHNGNLDLL